MLSLILLTYWLIYRPLIIYSFIHPPTINPPTLSPRVFYLPQTAGRRPCQWFPQSVVHFFALSYLQRYWFNNWQLLQTTQTPTWAKSNTLHNMHLSVLNPIYSLLTFLLLYLLLPNQPLLRSLNPLLSPPFLNSVRYFDSPTNLSSKLNLLWKYFTARTTTVRSTWKRWRRPATREKEKTRDRTSTLIKGKEQQRDSPFLLFWSFSSGVNYRHFCT